MQRQNKNQILNFRHRTFLQINQIFGADEAENNYLSILSRPVPLPTGRLSENTK